MAEAHPVGFQWVIEAKKRGARIIHVDPRFTRTSALADKHIAIRGGTDVVLLGALIKYVIDNDLYFREYVLHYTNAATLISEDFEDTEDLDGIFSGYDPENGTYDNSSWAYSQRTDLGDNASSWNVERDETLQDPRSVFQIVKRHYSRYTPEMVEKICGISQSDFEYLARSITENSNPERTTCFAYALGWTQHTLGAQFIRTCAILQLLLGNIGRPGSGIMALRGHASIQGSTDIPTLFNLLPGYLPMPTAEEPTLEDYLAKVNALDQKGFWQIGDAYAVSLLKAYFGDAATPENNFLYEQLPKLTGPASTYHTLQKMLRDEVDGYIVFGQNPAVAQSHGHLQRMGLSHLKWLVVRDFEPIETATFWKDSPEIKSGQLRTEDIATEVFYLPAANHVEKSGTFTQTQRMLQWRFQAVKPPGQAESELDFFYKLGKKIREKLAGSTDPRDHLLLNMTWDYEEDEEGDISADEVLKEINGYYASGDKAGELLPTFTEMRADGSTSGGCWIYAGVYADGVNRSKWKKPGSDQDVVANEWGWVWPANRRMLYNRASADPHGRPWSERKKYIWWDKEAGRWVGPDVPDFPATLDPEYRPEPDAVGAKAVAGDDAFIMQADGKGWLFAPTGMVDGPLPTHYEPQESPVHNYLYSQQQSPTRLVFPGQKNLSAPGPDQPGSGVYPYVFSTYRLTEHYTSGAMSRRLPFLAELQPELFCEVSPELAEERGLVNGGWATIVSPRSAIEARVLVSERIQPLKVNGKEYHQVGLPYHFGRSDTAAVSGDAPNDLLGITLDPNVSIQASKVGACDIRPGRRPRGRAMRIMVQQYQERAGLTPATGNKLVSREAELEAAQADALSEDTISTTQQTDTGMRKDPKKAGANKKRQHGPKGGQAKQAAGAKAAKKVAEKRAEQDSESAQRDEKEGD